jgi:hypothetical protein
VNRIAEREPARRKDCLGKDRPRKGTVAQIAWACS